MEWKILNLLFVSLLIVRKTVLLVLDIHKQQVKCIAKETMMENKLASALPKSVFVANCCLITRHDYLQWHLNKIGFRTLQCVHCAATPKKLTLATSKDVKVLQMPWTMTTARIHLHICFHHCGNYQIYTGLQERKLETSV